MSRAVVTSMAVAIGLLALGGCQKVTINPNDASAPVVEIKIKGDNGQYATAGATAQMSAENGQIDLMCIATDPQGVKSVSLSFVGGSDSCTVSGAIYNGSFPTEGLPSSQKQALSGDASNQVLTKLPLLAALKGPLTCTVLGAPSQKGTPYGSKVLVQCAGTNWSSNNQVSGAVKTLEVSLK